MFHRNPEFFWNAWHIPAMSSEAGIKALVERLLDLPLLLFCKTRSDEPVVLLDRCPHRFASLSETRGEATRSSDSTTACASEPTGATATRTATICASCYGTDNSMAFGSRATTT